MGWQLAGGLNVVIASCYLAIATLISLGLVRTRQLSSNPLAVATAAIFLTCALHHGHHGLHLLLPVADSSPEQVAAVRSVFGAWPSVLIDVLGAAVAITYLGLRRNYKALLSTPQMFEDRVRLASEHALHELAFKDVLTGIPNRAAYQELADRLSDDERPAVLLFLDLDGFKAVNDRFGHEAGDRVLRDVSVAVAGALHEEEHVFRLGGDELIVVGIDQRPSQIPGLRGRVESAVSRPIPTRDETIHVGASCGTAAGAARDLSRLLREADQDMYRVKNERWTQRLPTPRGA